MAEACQSSVRVLILARGPLASSPKVAWIWDAPKFQNGWQRRGTTLTEPSKRE